MSEGSTSFARKYRPNSLKNYVGNSAIKDTVTRYLRNSRLPQTILLTGNSGCGKTTLARIIAKEYLCENKTKDGACCCCPTCLAVDEYISSGNTENLADMYEIDATDSSGKKDIDSMLESMEYPPLGDWKVYIMDEVHMLSEKAMNRLLKSIEEPEEYVLMIFCTTNPEMLLPTIKNRCELKLAVTKPTTKDIVALLERVCLEEDRDYNIQGLRMIASRSDNVIRDSLNNIERVLSTRGSATDKSVSDEFREISDKIIFDFYNAFIKKDYMEYVGIMYKIKTTYTFEQFLISLSNFTKRGIYILNGIEVDGISEEELKSYMKLFKTIDAQTISYILSSLKRMNVGDIEANFMLFIYTDVSCVNGNNGNSVVGIGKESVSEEVKYRNTNLQRIESAKLSKGESILGSEMKPVAFDDLSNFFNLEKVSD